MRTQYNFEDDLATLRLLLGREHHFSEEKRYRKPEFYNMKTLVITLENWLRVDQEIEDKDERREIRLKILGFILECKVRTTYDLTVYQCSTIAHFLWNGPEDPDEDRTPEPGEDLRQRAIWLLEDCKDRIEGKTVHRERRLDHSRLQTHRSKVPGILPDLPNMFEADPGW